MLNDLLSHKKLNAKLPKTVIEQSRDGKLLGTLPKHLIPKESRCKECDYILTDPILITSKGRLLMTTGIVEGEWFESLIDSRFLHLYHKVRFPPKKKREKKLLLLLKGMHAILTPFG